MLTQQLTALVVDDDIVPRRMMCFALQSVGFECAFAVDGNDALARISKHSFDLVVTDLRMPGRHGHSLAVELLARPKPPIIAVHTSLDDPRLAEDLMNRGVDDIVYKPTNYLSFAGKDERPHLTSPTAREKSNRCPECVRCRMRTVVLRWTFQPIRRRETGV